MAASAVLSVDIRANALTLDSAHAQATNVREFIAKLDQRSPSIKVAANIKRMIPATSTSAAREEVLSRATILGGADRPMTLSFDDTAHGTIRVELIVTPDPEAKEPTPTQK